ncbi:MAG: PEP-CTERM sorting domain-containing protein [Burkholderiaceae bacterium]|jgi:type IV pilus assembly protein PilY1|nr:PEP-CTERM sorting domain-containing protein [Burkholderiaceae bacterium]
MKVRAVSLTVALVTAGFTSLAAANAILVSPNGYVRIGINDSGSLDTSAGGQTAGIGYRFPSGFADALTPGCPCEAWGVSANGLGGQVGETTGNQNITINAPSSTATTFTSNTALSTLPGLTVTQTYSIGAQSATGALFQDTVTIHNGTGAAITDLRYARAMDWDVPPTTFSEFVTIQGTGTTPSLLHSTDDGFANANPLTATGNAGIIGPVNADGTTGPADHGALFVFGFGGLADGADFTFNIFYGAGANRSDAVALLGLISPELFSLGMSNAGGSAATGSPTFVFAFNGVGGEVIIPPPDDGGGSVPAPAGLALLGIGGLALIARRRRG